MSTDIRLQSVGLVKGIQVSELQVGMRIMYNYGYTSDVISIAPKGNQSVSVVTRDTQNGKDYTSTMRLNRAIAAYWPRKG